MIALPAPKPEAPRVRIRPSPWTSLGAVLLAAVVSACAEDPPDPDSPGAAVGEVQVPAEVEAVLEKAECLTCHVLAGRGTPLGPSLTTVGSRLSAGRIREKIVDPAAFAVEGYENLAGTMPSDFGERLGEEELDALVRYLAGRR